MKINRLLFCPAAIIGLIAVSVWAAETARTMSVQVKNASLRDAPAFIGKVTATLSYGDRVETLAAQGPWTKVRTADAVIGWTHTSALTPKRIILKSGQETAQTKASGDELALAGKGFNSDIEGEFKRLHKNIDFSWIDKMEKIKIPPAEMQSFLKEGGVVPAEGGAQ